MVKCFNAQLVHKKSEENLKDKDKMRRSQKNSMRYFINLENAKNISQNTLRYTSY